MAAPRSVKAKRPSNAVDPSTRVKGFDLGYFLDEIARRCQSPFADHYRELLRQKAFDKIIDLAVSPSSYNSRDDFAKDYLLASLVKKYQGFRIPGLDRRARAFEKWRAAEESCSRVNFFLRSLLDGQGIPYPHRVVEILYLAQRKVSKILGSVDFDYIREHCRFGPGSDLSTDGDFTSSYNKYRTKGSATPWILDTFSEVFSEDRREDYLHECEFVTSNRLSFVPKNAKIDRSICTEPRWNIYLQLGIGELINQRLLRYGLDVKLQFRNQELARIAHVFGLATIDISSASDCVAKSLVLFLLPDDWSDLLFKSRSPSAIYRGRRYLLEKISSMGNGYTFPLESLIFFALAESTADFCDAPRVIGTFGDDLVIPDEIYPQFTEVLSYLGFDVNNEKSFRKGRFHESCGKDYFDGVDVRPFFLKKRVSTVLDLYILANQISEYSRRLPAVSQALDLKTVRDYVIGLIPEEARLFGPIGLAGVLHSTFDECCPKTASQQFGMSGWEGWVVKAWHAKPKRFLGNDYTAHLFSKLTGDLDTGNAFTTRGQVTWSKKDTDRKSVV